MWRKYFKLIGLVPGPVIVQGVGTIDFSGDVPVEVCKELFEQDFRYLELTDEGKEKLYGIGAPSNSPGGGEQEREKKKEKKKTTSITSTSKTARGKRRSSTRTYKRRTPKGSS